MPTYEYACKDNDHNFEVVQSFHDDALTQCEVCGGPVRKVFSPAGIVFKGSGFYVTDSRGKKPASASPSTAETSSDKSSDTSSDKPSTTQETSTSKSGAGSSTSSSSSDTATASTSDSD